MIMFILMAGTMFTGVFAASGGMSVMKNVVESLNLALVIITYFFISYIYCWFFS